MSLTYSNLKDIKGLSDSLGSALQNKISPPALQPIKSTPTWTGNSGTTTPPPKNFAQGIGSVLGGIGNMAGNIGASMDRGIGSFVNNVAQGAGITKPQSSPSAIQTATTQSPTGGMTGVSLPTSVQSGTSSFALPSNGTQTNTNTQTTTPPPTVGQTSSQYVNPTPNYPTNNNQSSSGQQTTPYVNATQQLTQQQNSPYNQLATSAIGGLQGIAQNGTPQVNQATTDLATLKRMMLFYKDLSVETQMLAAEVASGRGQIAGQIMQRSRKCSVSKCTKCPSTTRTANNGSE